MSNHVSVHLEIVLESVQDSCMVCAKHTIGSETVLDASMVLQGDEARVQYFVSVNLYIVLILMQDRCTVCAERTIGLKIILDTPVGTLRLRRSSGSSFSVRLSIVLTLT